MSYILQRENPLSFPMRIAVADRIAMGPRRGLKPQDDWKAILEIARKLQIEWIHERAFEELSKYPLDAIDKVVIAQRFEDKRWIVRQAYVTLVRREKPLSTLR